MNYILIGVAFAVTLIVFSFVLKIKILKKIIFSVMILAGVVFLAVGYRNDFDFVPSLTPKETSYNYQSAEEVQMAVNRYVISNYKASKSTADPIDLVVYKITNDTMEPLIKKGSYIAADKNDTDVETNDIIYVISDGRAAITRVISAGDKLICKADNQKASKEYRYCDIVGTVILPD